MLTGDLPWDRHSTSTEEVFKPAMGGGFGCGWKLAANKFMSVKGAVGRGLDEGETFKALEYYKMHEPVLVLYS